MKTLATIGDNCVDIYPQLNKAFSGGNAVNVAVYCTRYGIKPGCITWVGDDDYGTKLKQDLARMGVDISHVHTKHGVTAQTQVELHDNDRVFGDYTEGVMADFALSEEDYAWLAQYDIVHAAIWGHAGGRIPAPARSGQTYRFRLLRQVGQPALADTGAASRFCLCLRVARRRSSTSEDEGDCCPWRGRGDCHAG